MKKIEQPELKQHFIDETDFEQQFSSPMNSQAQLVYFAANEFLIQDVQRPEFLYYLVKGRVKLYDNLPNGKTALIDFFMAPCFVGEMELIDPQSEPFGVQAITDCWCLALPIAQVRKTCMTDSVFLQQLCRYLAQKNIRNVETAALNQSYSFDQRLTAFILTTRQGSIYREKHTEVAQYLGVTYRHLLLVLARFVKDGLLIKDKRQYRIGNEQELIRLAKNVHYPG